MKTLEPKTYTKIFFEDNGQDFLYWIIDDQGRVVSAGPFQNEIWRDNVVDLDSLEPGEPLFLTSKHNGEYMELIHKVEKVATGPLAILEWSRFNAWENPITLKCSD